MEQDRSAGLVATPMGALGWTAALVQPLPCPLRKARRNSSGVPCVRRRASLSEGAARIVAFFEN
jgi:hypothetical protein